MFLHQDLKLVTKFQKMFGKLKNLLKNTYIYI
jgi:hypothetical protein